jgi:drug/metabolite transporter (DMT)-like permease
MSSFVVFAALAGVCGALSGFAVKIATSGWPLGPLPVVVVFAVFMAVNVLLTGQMWRFYLKALALGPTPATMMTSTAVNMTVSAAVGALVLGEHIGPQYAAGAALMAIGLALIAKSPS